MRYTQWIIQTVKSREADNFSVSFHFGAFCFDVRQFGAFQFGAFHFDALPLRRVSLWRASTLARFTFARFHFGAFHFGAFPIFLRTYGDPVPANASFARTICVHVSFPRFPIFLI